MMELIIYFTNSVTEFFSVYEVIKYYIEVPLFSVRVIIITDSVDS